MTALLQAAIRDVLNMAATRDEHREALYRLESVYANWKPAATPPASVERCPAAKHHRMRTSVSGKIIDAIDGDLVYSDPEIESDRCVACGFDFLATPPASAERALIAAVQPYLDAGYDLDYIRDALEEATRE